MKHVYPLGDSREHMLDGTPCWCNPQVKWIDDDTGEPLPEPITIHASSDYREYVEQAEAIANVQTRG